MNETDKIVILAEKPQRSITIQYTPGDDDSVMLITLVSRIIEGHLKGIDCNEPEIMAPVVAWINSRYDYK